MALFFAFYATAPALLGVSLAFLAHGQDRLASSLMGLGMVVLTWYTQIYGHRWILSKVRPEAYGLMNLLRLAGLLMAPVVFVMVFRLL